MNTTENLITINVKHISSTYSKDSRVKMTLPRFNASKTIPFDYVFNNSTNIAKNFLENEGVIIEYQTESKLNEDSLLCRFSEVKTLEKIFKF